MSRSFEFHFDIHTDAPFEFIKRWRKFKKICEGGESNNEPICAAWSSSCLLLENRDLLFLKRSEGGIGDLLCSKELRFRDLTFDQWRNPHRINDTIVVEGYGIWSQNEIDDLLSSFAGMATACLQSGAICVSGSLVNPHVNFDDEDVLRRAVVPNDITSLILA